MQAAMQGRALSSSTDVALGELSFEFMLNALRLRSGFELSLYTERTGLSVSRIQAALETAQAKGLISRTGNHIAPTTLGFDFLSDLQSLFLSA